ncbi:unnamed protein product [Ciceribacter sp. T2.26MG-112.2]|uniref:hypothetical protein n=1 Tax=Ciceribacter sp. T2.26MG-112.2 TaxID=3137154 RepID=UPI000E13264A|nr:hypothetical protein [Ciceribacter naphthalenivorans]SSC74159.1 unnamed protein product [Ciceribacter naphthalenivorans]
MNRQLTIDMPDEMHAELERHAAAAGMSLEAYLVDVLIARISREESLRQKNAGKAEETQLGEGAP